MKTKLMYLPVVLLAVAVLEVQAAPERMTASFSDPSRPGLLKVQLLNGSIHVKAYDGNQVIVDAGTKDEETHHGAPPGMHRIPMRSGVELVEENNQMTLRVSALNLGVDMNIQVPSRTSLKLKTVNGGEISVEGVQGEIEADNTNGAVTLHNVAGSVVAHALNGKVTATFTSVDPQKPMSFSSLNGEIDVTLPASVKANVKLKTDNGEVFSDFDIVTRPSAGPVVEDSRSSKGKYKVKIDKTVYGTINGGGPEYQFSNFNGSIFIRKGK